jgi:hypothetical protein
LWVQEERNIFVARERQNLSALTPGVMGAAILDIIEPFPQKGAKYRSWQNHVKVRSGGVDSSKARQLAQRRLQPPLP